MAFSKIAGFDVTPRSDSSSIIRCSSPFSLSERGKRASHTLTPAAARPAASADEALLGVEDVDGVGDAAPEARAAEADGLAGALVAAVRSLDDHAAVLEAALAPEPVERGAGGQRLQRARLREAVAVGG